MTERKWTPGPWLVEVDESSQVERYPMIASENYGVVGSEGMYGVIETDYANAHLIAAAPDLYEALESLVRDYDIGEMTDTPELDAANAALAKARGEQ